MNTKTYKKLTDTGVGPNWFSDNERLLFLDNGKLYTINIDTGVRRLIKDFPENLPKDWSYFTFSPDNKSIYYVKQEKESDIWMGFLN